MSYPNEYEAVEAGMKLVEENKLWALVVFVDPGDAVLNPNTTYKIRYDKAVILYFKLLQLLYKASIRKPFPINDTCCAVKILLIPYFCTELTKIARPTVNN